MSDSERKIVLSEPVNAAFVRAVASEFIATSAYVFVVLLAFLANCILNHDEKNANSTKLSSPYGIVTTSVCNGLVGFVLVHTFSHLSGAHFNPAITIACLAARLVTPLRAGLYVFVQMLGGFLASALVVNMTGMHDTHYFGWNATPATAEAVANHKVLIGYNVMSGSVHANTYVRAFTTEFILTAMITLTVFATIDPSRTKVMKSFGSLVVGLAIMAAHLIAMPITLCGTNPARSLGPALLSNAYGSKNGLWVFLIAPVLGALSVVPLYCMFLAEKNFVGAKIPSLSGEKGTTTP